jgi:hypothetical protein
MKQILKTIALTVSVAMLSVFLFTSFFCAETMNDTVSKVVSNSRQFENAERIKFYYDAENAVLTVVSIKSLDIGNEPIDYIDVCVKVKISEDGIMNYLPEKTPSGLSLDEARTMISKRLWLFKTDLYDNTEILDYTKTPINDYGIEKYPLLDDFSTAAKFTDYLKTVFTKNIAEHYLQDTTITSFGNELYDIGGKVAQFTFDSENFAVTEVFASENGLWHLYRVTIQFDNDMHDLDGVGAYDDFYVGFFYTENGWRIAQTTFKNDYELFYFETYDKKATAEKNPSTSDLSVLFPLILSISFTGTLLCFKRGK